MMKLEFLFGISGESVSFIDAKTGNTIDPIQVLELCSLGEIHIERSSRIEKVETESMAFGAPRPGVRTLLDVVEREISFKLIINLKV